MISNIAFLILAASSQVVLGQSDDTCEEEGGIVAEVSCPDETSLIKGLGSRYPFFSDAIGATCSAMDDEKTFSCGGKEFAFESPDGGLSLSAQCPEENQVIAGFRMCIKDFHVQSMTLRCHDLLEQMEIGERFNETSDDNKHVNVLCGNYENLGIHSIHFMDSGDGVVTRVVLGCVAFQSPDWET